MSIEVDTPQLVLLIGTVVLALVFFIRNRLEKNKQFDCIFKIPAVSEKFDYKITEPLRFRPWKPVYHMVMNISKVVPEDWLHIDREYDWMVRHHQELLEKYPTKTCQANPSKETLAGCQELYNTVFSVLSQKYPEYFKLEKGFIINTLRNVTVPFPAESTKMTSKQLLRVLVENTEEDYQVLQHATDSDEYILRAVGGLTSDGFMWADKIDLQLTDVHGPVPQYKEKLQKSMNRYFNKIEPGSIIQRFTWGITIGSASSLSKFELTKDVTGTGPDGSLSINDIDFHTDCWVRVERQVPTKLPKTGFLILTQHTYWYPIDTIKEEGLGEMTAQAIESWPEGFAKYKSRETYGDAVCEYLRM